jgi:hypothetical protein
MLIKFGRDESLLAASIEKFLNRILAVVLFRTEQTFGLPHQLL